MALKRMNRVEKENKTGQNLNVNIRNKALELQEILQLPEGLDPRFEGDGRGHLLVPQWRRHIKMRHSL